MRYTEAKMSKIASEMLKDIEKENFVRDTETAFDSYYLKSNVSDLISIDSFEKVETKRKQYFWWF